MIRNSFFLLTCILLSFSMAKVTKGEGSSVVSGYVLDQSTMQPVVGAIVEYQEWNVSSKAKKTKDNDGPNHDKKAFTDAHGHFVLTFDSNRVLNYSTEKGEFNGYPIKVSYQDNTLFSILDVSTSEMQKKASKKQGFHNLIIIDPEWIVAPPPTTPAFISFLDQLNLSTISATNCVGKGEIYQRSRVAIYALNTARKVSWRYKSLSDFDFQIVTQAYLTVNRLWQYFFYSCQSRKGMGAEHARFLSESINNEIAPHLNN